MIGFLLLPIYNHKYQLILIYKSNVICESVKCAVYMTQSLSK